MGDAQFVWDLDDDPDGNVEHIRQHGVTQEEVEEVLLNPAWQTIRSRSTGRRLTQGHTSAGRWIIVARDLVDDDPMTIYPVSAYEPDDPLDE